MVNHTLDTIILYSDNKLWCNIHCSRLQILIQWKGHHLALEAVRNLSKEIHFSVSAKADRSIAGTVSDGRNLEADLLHHYIVWYFYWNTEEPSWSKRMVIVQRIRCKSNSTTYDWSSAVSERGSKYYYNNSFIFLDVFALLGPPFHSLMSQ